VTTLWKVPPDLWAGQTVAILASGPSMCQALAESVRGYPCIALNHTARFAPHADMIVALDGISLPKAENFAGLRVTGNDDPESDALYVGQMWERITLGPNNVVEVRNSGLAAIRIAAAAGASKILLVAFEPEAAPGVYPAMIEGLAAIISELRERGVEVERVGAMNLKTPGIADRGLDFPEDDGR
jgi:hypothetical protein